MVKNKDTLAKLLATENITIRRSVKAETASFDLKNRVLTLPVLKVTSGDIMDMMTGHEVGHALWTLMTEWFKAIEEEKIHKQILNIVEDARIEKKIKRKYPGIVKSFINGYKDLESKGFFGFNKPDMTMPLIDRINLHAKMGWTGNIPFSDDEQWAVDAVAGVESFDDVKRVSKMLQMDYVESEQFKADDFGDDFGSSRMDGGEEYDISESDIEESEESGDDTSETTTRESREPDPDDFDGSTTDDLMDDEFNTESTFEDKKKELSDEKADEYVYIKLPKPNLKQIIVPYKECDNLYGYMDAAYKPVYGQNEPEIVSHISDTADEFNVFRRDSQKIINYMVKEFERRKAANEHRRISIAKTGILDVNKLHSYRYNEDLFLKNTIMPDGKNHGMVMLLDWSASMCNNMTNTVKQLLNLVWFCQKVNIPFEVYAFSNTYQSAMRSKIDAASTEAEIRRFMGNSFSRNSGELDIQSKFTLLNFFSSRMSSRDITRMGKALYAAAYAMRGWRSDSALREFSLSSTPLVEALITMQTVIPNFIKAYKLHRTNFIVLTDGDANTGADRVYKGDEEHYAAGRFDGYGVQGIYESPITRKSYRLDKICKYYSYKYDRQVNLLIRLLRDDYNVNTIGIFLDNESRGKSVKRKHIEKYLGWHNYNREAHAKVRLGVKKNGFATIKELAGYNEYYIVPTGSTIIEDGRIGEVDADITKGKLKTLFAKAQKGKFGSRILADKMMNWLV